MSSVGSSTEMTSQRFNCTQSLTAPVEYFELNVTLNTSAVLANPDVVQLDESSPDRTWHFLTSVYTSYPVGDLQVQFTLIFNNTPGGDCLFSFKAEGDRHSSTVVCLLRSVIMMNALIIVYMYICFILFYNFIPNVDGQPNPQQFSVLREPIADVSDWTYGENENGPRYWPYLHPQYCSGQYQSPIAIITRKTFYNPRLTEFALFHDPPLPGSKFQVHNTGHTVEVNTVGQFFITNGGLGNIYKTAQFHFHWGKHSNRGSEHTIDGKRAPLEMHIVSWNQKYMNADDAAKYTDGLAVLSILFKLSTRDNPVLEPVIQVLPEVRDPDDHTLITIPATSIKHFLPKFPDRYFRYHGSLTTPNCNQAVIWSVFEQPQFISERQLNYFRQMLASSTHLETKLQRQLDLATN
ncbi:carbonic anhydrase-like, partial [Ruditapes philippinarum]|uniref:carbonic anhydrase-like n=1 Tax=Ruditapes philippinarum TaxID=129788 RepID=UPI00295B04A4